MPIDDEIMNGSFTRQLACGSLLSDIVILLFSSAQNKKINMKGHGEGYLFRKI